MNLNPAFEKPRMTRMITVFAKGGSLLRAHPSSESSLQRYSFFIREIRGSKCFFQDESALSTLFLAWTSPKEPSIFSP
jgi:hypothetical protein